MRALLVVNPAATTTSARTRDVLIHALASEMKLEAVTTEYRGHARDLGRRAADGGRHRPGRGARRRRHGQRGRQRAAAQRPRPRTPAPPRGGPRRLHQCLRPRPRVCPTTPSRRPARCWTRCASGSERTVGLGLAAGTPGTEDEAVPARWFTFCAGFGFDAGVVGRVEQQRERGKTFDARPLHTPGGAPVPRRSRTAGTARSRWSGPARTR